MTPLVKKELVVLITRELEVGAEFQAKIIVEQLAAYGWQFKPPEVEA